MKPLRTALAALLLALCAGLAAGADAPALVEWRADLSTTEVRNLYLRHGDSATLRARLYLRGNPYNPTNAVAYFSTNGLASSDWWVAPSSIASNTVSIAWTPLLEKSGANVYPFVLRIDGSAYRAAAMLYLRTSPGETPAADGFVLDFDSIAYTNAPWATPQDAVTAALDAIRDAVSAISTGGADTIDDTHDLLLELIESLKQNPNPTP